MSVIRVPPGPSLRGFSMEADPWKCFTNPHAGGAETVARAVRALSVCGATPLGLTDCLNFPSPEKPEQFWELQESLRGMAEACRALACPVVSGNVSLYNESPAGRILPTPVVVAAGVLPSQPCCSEDVDMRETTCSLWEIPRDPWGPAVIFPDTATSCGANHFPLQGGGSGLARRAQTTTAREGTARSGRVLAGGGLAVALAKEVMASGVGIGSRAPPFQDKTSRCSLEKADPGHFMQ